MEYDVNTEPQQEVGDVLVGQGGPPALTPVGNACFKAKSVNTLLSAARIDGVESHTSSCRDKLQKPVAPRRQGSWVSSPRTLGLGPPPFLCTDATHAVSRVLLPVQLGRFLFGLPARGF